MPNIKTVLNSGPMSPFQRIVVSICIAIFFADGLDVQAIAFAAPDIAKAWHVQPALLGTLLAAGPVGMALGSLILTSLADLLGRRPITLICMLLITVGMFLSALAQNVEQLMALRVATGLGIGGLLGSATTTIAEYTPERWRSFSVGLMTTGFPGGAVIGGTIAVYLVTLFDWRAIFVFGGLFSTLLLPFVMWNLPESMDYLIMKRGPKALERLNAILKRAGRAPLTALPPATADEDSSRAIIGAFAPELRWGAFLICTSFFMLMVSLYFLFSWTPKILSDLGLSTQVSISGSVFLNIGGMIGCSGYGFFSRRMEPRLLSACIMVLCFCSVVVFGALPPNLEYLLPIALLMGIGVMGGIAGQYAIVPLIFPTHARATGTGLGIGIGRIGAVLGPYVAGVLIAAGWGRFSYSLALASPLLIAAATIIRAPLLGEIKERSSLAKTKMPA